MATSTAEIAQESKDSLANTHLNNSKQEAMFPKFGVIEPLVTDCSGLLEPVKSSFLEWAENFKFDWNKKSGGRVIPRSRFTIKSKDSTSTPSTPIPPTSLLLSPRLTFRRAISSSISPNPTPSTSYSAFSVTKPPLFRTEFFEARKSPKGGYGAFAVKDIKVGTVILSEKPLLKSNGNDIYYRYEELSPEERKAYRSLFGYSGLSRCQIQAIFMTNRFEISKTDGGIFIHSSRFNHACPDYKTCSYRYHRNSNLLVTTAYKNIKKGEEITISYARNPTHLFENYGFRCDCPSCPDKKVAEMNEKIMRGDLGRCTRN